MYIIEPLAITAANGRLESSSVAYPDGGPSLDGTPNLHAVYRRWAFGRAYAVGDIVSYYEKAYRCLVAVSVWNPEVPTTIGNLYAYLPPSHSLQLMIGWAPLYSYETFDGFSFSDQFEFDEFEHPENTIIGFPGVHHLVSNPFPVNPSTLTVDPSAPIPTPLPGGAASLTALMHSWIAPTSDYDGYPSGVWRRNGVADDGESLRPKFPSSLSKYWDAVEPPLFEKFPEIPLGELTTYGGRVWRKRTATMAAYEAPSSAPDDWALVKTSNRFAMFDASVQSQTRQSGGSAVLPIDPSINETLEVTLATGSNVVDALALLNLDATTVRVQVKSGSPLATVYDRSFGLNADVNVANWYDWFFARRVTFRSLVLDDLPPVVGGRIVITITNTGSQAACGVCIVGKRTYIGDAMYGASVGIKDYSLKTTDEFGNISTKQRSYSDRMTVPVRLHNDSIERIKLLLAKYRTVPLLWVGHAGIPSTIVYGYYKDFSAVINYAKEATCNLEIEGLT